MGLVELNYRPHAYQATEGEKEVRQEICNSLMDSVICRCSPLAMPDNVGVNRQLNRQQRGSSRSSHFRGCAHVSSLLKLLGCSPAWSQPNRRYRYANRPWTTNRGTRRYRLQRRPDSPPADDPSATNGLCKRVTERAGNGIGRPIGAHLQSEHRSA